MRFPRFLALAATPLPLAALLATPATASALEVGVRVEPGFAVPLTSPQSQRFNPGGELSLKAYLGLGRYFDVQAGASFLGLSAQVGTLPATMGTAWSESLGFRLKRPHDAGLPGGGFYAGSPWIDADALYVRTGGLDRFGLNLGAGVSFPLEKRRIAWLGPFVRYRQIVDMKHEGFDDGDGRFIILGLNLEIGSSPLPRPKPVEVKPVPVIVPVPVPCPTCAPVPPPPPELDHDHDGIVDTIDVCPDVAGLLENRGCPTYKKVIIKQDKLELTEKIFFAFDKSIIEPKSFALLDDVVQALQDNRGFRVQIEGNTDSVGSKDHNQTLSEERAKSVLEYLKSHGVRAERLNSLGFGESKPTDTNNTPAGREKNRRVDFVVKFRILDRSAQ